MRGLLGGMMTGGLVSVLGLGAVSVVTEQPAGVTPPDAPLVQAPVVEPVDAAEPQDGPSTPVGSLSIQAPQAPDFPDGEAAIVARNVPAPVGAEPTAPRADTDPLDEPEVSSIEGSMAAPDAPDVAGVAAQPVDPVLPNPQSLAPQTPVNEADLSVSTAPAQPRIIVVPSEDDVEIATDQPAADDQSDEFFVVDLGADAPVEVDVADEEVAVMADTPEPVVPDAPVQAPNAEIVPADDEPQTEDMAAQVDAPAEQPEDEVLAAVEPEQTQPRLQLQGGDNALPGNSDSGVIVRRPDGGDATDAGADAVTDALTLYAAPAGDNGSKPLMSIVLIDDGTMSAAAAALFGLPFPVTIALDPATENVGELMTTYRASGYEVAVMAKLPEGATPQDVEVTFESVFAALPETIAVLDVGDGGLQSSRDVTEQAMDILAAQGRGFVTVSQGLNMAGRAAEQSGVPAAVVYRDLDRDDQDTRVVRRFVDQAAFRARQESGVVLVGRVRPDTISALILWGTANQDDQVAIAPLSAVLTAQ